MKITTEKSLRNFEFWSGAKDRADALTWEQLDRIEEMLQEIESDGMDETAINDLFWFEEDTIAEWLGFESFEALERYNNGEEMDEEYKEEGEEEDGETITDAAARIIDAVADVLTPAPVPAIA